MESLFGTISHHIERTNMKKVILMVIAVMFLVGCATQEKKPEKPGKVTRLPDKGTIR